MVQWHNCVQQNFQKFIKVSGMHTDKWLHSIVECTKYSYVRYTAQPYSFTEIDLAHRPPRWTSTFVHQLHASDFHPVDRHEIGFGCYIACSHVWTKLQTLCHWGWSSLFKRCKPTNLWISTPFCLEQWSPTGPAFRMKCTLPFHTSTDLCKVAADCDFHHVFTAEHVQQVLHETFLLWTKGRSQLNRIHFGTACIQKSPSKWLAPRHVQHYKFRYEKALAVNPINMSNGSTFSYGLNRFLLLYFRGQLRPVREKRYKDLQISKAASAKQ